MPNDPHSEFIELAALRTANALSADEEQRLEGHLATCAVCRDVAREYDRVIAQAIPALGPDRPEDDATFQDEAHLDDAERRLFARLRAEQQSTEADANVRTLGIDPLPRAVADVLWHRFWWQAAASVLLLLGVGYTLFKVAEHRGMTMALLNSRLPAKVATPIPSSTLPYAAENRVAELEQRLHGQEEEIERLRRQARSADEQVKAGDNDIRRLSTERATLAEKLAQAEQTLGNLRTDADARSIASARSTEMQTRLSQKLDELRSELRDRDRQIAEEHDLLDRDRDIRDLMSSRELYIAEVYDVAKSGETERPFGRVFYTRGKSLIFYAYDLKDQAGVTEASTFQAWGRRGPDREKALNLGIFYEDNATSKRWVLKSHSPKTLAEIDAVFVTVEPKGGSAHPSTKPLLFAYLKVDPNHP